MYQSVRFYSHVRFYIWPTICSVTSQHASTPTNVVTLSWFCFFVGVGRRVPYIFLYMKPFCFKLVLRIFSMHFFLMDKFIWCATFFGFFFFAGSLAGRRLQYIVYIFIYVLNLICNVAAILKDIYARLQSGSSDLQQIPENNRTETKDKVQLTSTGCTHSNWGTWW